MLHALSHCVDCVPLQSTKLDPERSSLVLYAAELLAGIIEVDRGVPQRAWLPSCVSSVHSVAAVPNVSYNFPLLAACTIKKVTDQVLLMFGTKAQNVVGQPLSTLLPNATPNRSIDDLFGGVVARRGGLGGKAKRTLGKMQHLVSSIRGPTQEEGDMGRSAAFLACWSS